MLVCIRTKHTKYTNVRVYGATCPHTSCKLDTYVSKVKSVRLELDLFLLCLRILSVDAFLRVNMYVMIEAFQRYDH